MAGRAAAVLRPAGCARLRGGEEAAGEPPQAALTDEDLERTVFARGCVLIDASDPETPLYAKNPDAPIIPASTTKIMTCILAIEMAGDLSAAVAVPDEAARLGGSNSRMGLVRGESLPMRDLLYGLMPVSANDAALAIACHLAGSAEDFAALMNGKAAALGMEDTRFAAPSGVYRSGYTSTAHDMARLMAYAMRSGTFRQIVSAAEYTVPANGVRRHELHLVNSNRLISDPETSSYYYEYAIGGKTGTTTVGGKCLVAVAERDGAVLIASLMARAMRSAAGAGWKTAALPTRKACSKGHMSCCTRPSRRRRSAARRSAWTRARKTPARPTPVRGGWRSLRTCGAGRRSCAGRISRPSAAARRSSRWSHRRMRRGLRRPFSRGRRSARST